MLAGNSFCKYFYHKDVFFASNSSREREMEEVFSNHVVIGD